MDNDIKFSNNPRTMVLFLFYMSQDNTLQCPIIWI